MRTVVILVRGQGLKPCSLLLTLILLSLLSSPVGPGRLRSESNRAPQPFSGAEDERTRQQAVQRRGQAYQPERLHDARA